MGRGEGEPGGDGKGVMERQAAGLHPRKAPKGFQSGWPGSYSPPGTAVATKRRGQQTWLLSSPQASGKLREEAEK